MFWYHNLETNDMKTKLGSIFSFICRKPGVYVDKDQRNFEVLHLTKTLHLNI